MNGGGRPAAHGKKAGFAAGLDPIRYRFAEDFGLAALFLSDCRKRNRDIMEVRLTTPSLVQCSHFSKYFKAAHTPIGG